MTAKRPKRVRVGPYVYRVHQSRKQWALLVDQDMSGGTCNSSMTIWLDPTLDEQASRMVLLHEVMHACWHLAGGVDALARKPDVEELACRMLATPMLAVLRDNPKLVKWLASHVS